MGESNQYTETSAGGVLFTDKVRDLIKRGGKTLQHADKMFINGATVNNEFSTLSTDGYFYNEKGNLTHKYDKYDKFSHSVDIDYDKVRKRVVTIPNGIRLFQEKSVTVKLNDNNEIDFSLPENQAILNNDHALVEIVSKYPESLESIPAHVFEQYGTDIQFAYIKGVQKNVAQQNFGVDKNGDEIDITGYYNKMSGIMEFKKQQVQDLKNARTRFQNATNQQTQQQTQPSQTSGQTQQQTQPSQTSGQTQQQTQPSQTSGQTKQQAQPSKTSGQTKQQAQPSQTQSTEDISSREEALTYEKAVIATNKVNVKKLGSYLDLEALEKDGVIFKDKQGQMLDMGSKDYDKYIKPELMDAAKESVFKELFEQGKEDDFYEMSDKEIAEHICNSYTESYNNLSIAKSNYVNILDGQESSTGFSEGLVEAFRNNADPDVLKEFERTYSEQEVEQMRNDPTQLDYTVVEKVSFADIQEIKEQNSESFDKDLPIDIQDYSKNSNQKNQELGDE